MSDAAAVLAADPATPHIVHQTGERDVELVREGVSRAACER